MCNGKGPVRYKLVTERVPARCNGKGLVRYKLVTERCFGEGRALTFFAYRRPLDHFRANG